VALIKRPADLGRISLSATDRVWDSMCFGGPHSGSMACSATFLAQNPGRVVGATKDRSGRRPTALRCRRASSIFAANEPRAISAPNQGMLALRAAIYLSAMGRQGLAKVASLCLDKSHYAADRIAKSEGF